LTINYHEHIRFLKIKFKNQIYNIIFPPELTKMETLLGGIIDRVVDTLLFIDHIVNSPYVEESKEGLVNMTSKEDDESRIAQISGVLLALKSKMWFLTKGTAKDHPQDGVPSLKKSRLPSLKKPKLVLTDVRDAGDTEKEVSPNQKDAKKQNQDTVTKGTKQNKKESKKESKPHTNTKQKTNKDDKTQKQKFMPKWKKHDEEWLNYMSQQMNKHDEELPLNPSTLHLLKQQNAKQKSLSDFDVRDEVLMDPKVEEIPRKKHGWKSLSLTREPKNKQECSPTKMSKTSKLKMFVTEKMMKRSGKSTRVTSVTSVQYIEHVMPAAPLADSHFL